jgi:hypothetical protein
MKRHLHSVHCGIACDKLNVHEHVHGQKMWLCVHTNMQTMEINTKRSSIIGENMDEPEGHYTK